MSTVPATFPETESASDARTRAGLVEKHFDYVWRLLRRMGLPAADADDAAQEVFLVAIQKMQSIRPGRDRAFLYGCALNKAAQFRTARNRQHEPLGAQYSDALAPSTDDLLERKKAQDVLDGLLEHLSHDQRAVFVLYEVEEMTFSEIADLLGIPTGTVASRLRLARARVQHQLALFDAAVADELLESKNSEAEDRAWSAAGGGPT
jgi:RNA polymerase sigma-70 factor (ECF subfamily)